MPKEAIHLHAKNIGIPWLVHFTRAVNLPNIMKYGLYPRSRTSEISVTPQINDVHRFDGHIDGTSLSIAFPNSKMFYKCRQENPNVDWVVLAVNPAALWTLDCAFCRHNAAATVISKLPIESLKTFEAFQGMFEEIEGLPKRGEDRLKSYDPTDVQAEILVFDVIPPQYIFGVGFNSDLVKQQYAEHLGSRQAVVYKYGMFSNRADVRRRQT